MSTGRRRGLPAALVAVVIVVLLGVLALPIASFARDAKGFWPAHWDPRIAPIAQRDEAIRGLNYLHPVPVRFLSDAAFKKLVGGGSSDSSQNRSEVEREAATFRSLGLLGGKVDFLKVTKQVTQAGVLAFYDFDKKEIVVRGTHLDVSHRATLSHELTHVLQDQHFDIRAIDNRAAQADEHSGGSAEAMLALIEGDANDVMARYVKGLSPADRQEYVREQEAQSTGIGKASVGVPQFVELVFSAPYELGPLTIQVLRASGGNRAVNAALTGPIPTTADFVQAGLVAPAPDDLAAPALKPGERAVGLPESFGAFELYLTLATHVDAIQAIDAADLVEGGRARSFRAGSTSCYRVALESRDSRAASVVAASIRRWGASAYRPVVTSSGVLTTFSACDPGARAVAPSTSRLTAAELLVGARAGLVVGVAERGIPAGAARCLGRLVANAPGALSALEQSGAGTLSAAATARLQEQVRQAAVTCRNNLNAGLP